MIVKLLSETGYREAISAMRLSRQSTSASLETIGPEDKKLMLNLLRAGDEHSVALRMVNFTFKIKAPLYWWKHMDRYSVGKTQASESTMYNIMKRELTAFDFSHTVDVRIIKIVNQYIRTKNFEMVIANLPSGYLQTRIVQFSLPTLRRIIRQRLNHKLREWNFFIASILDQVREPEFLFEIEE